MSQGQIDILGIPIQPFDLAGALFFISKLSSGYVVTVNPETFRYFERDRVFKEAVLAASLRICDGVGVQAAARLLKGIKIQRVPGIDLVSALLASHEGPYFLLGGRKEVVVRAAKNIHRRYPLARVCGTCDGYTIHDEEGRRRAEAEILLARPRFILVGLGIPRQEIWMLHHQHLFRDCVAIGVGGTLDVLAGAVHRAPRFVCTAGLEWMWRLSTQPSRLPRFVHSHLPFAAQVASASILGNRAMRSGNPS